MIKRQCPSCSAEIKISSTAATFRCSSCKKTFRRKASTSQAQKAVSKESASTKKSKKKLLESARALRKSIQENSAKRTSTSGKQWASVPPATQVGTMELPEDNLPPEDDVDIVDTYAGIDVGSITDSADEIPETIGPYRILKMLGRGSRGTVYEALDSRNHEKVALKVFRLGLDAELSEIDQIQAEINAARHLSHPNIVPVLDGGEENDIHYFAVEYVEGDSLDKWLRRGDCSYEDRVALIEKLCRAVHSAHEAGIIHGNLKPENILVDELDEPHLTDFGFTIVGNPESEMGGLGTGSPAYLSPEQIEGRWHEVDARTDVWGVGAVLYEALIGRPPFTGEDTYQVTSSILNDNPPPLRRIEERIPKDLETLVLKCMEKQPNKRYENLNELSRDIGKWLDGEPISARSSLRLPRTRSQRSRRSQMQMPMFAPMESPLKRRLKWLFKMAITFAISLGIALGFRHYAKQRNKENVEKAKKLQEKQAEQLKKILEQRGAQNTGTAQTQSSGTTANGNAASSQPNNTGGKQTTQNTSTNSRVAPTKPKKTAGQFLQEGKTHLTTGNNLSAVYSFTQALLLNSKLTEAYNLRATARTKMKDWYGALSDYNQSLAIDPNDIDIRTKRAQLRQVKGDLEGAIQDASKIIQSRPKDFSAYLLRGNTRQAKKEYDGAVQDYSKAISLSPGSVESYLQRSICYTMQKNFTAAENDVEFVLSKNSQNAVAYGTRGIIRQQQKKMDEALADHNKAISLNPKYTMSYYHRGVIQTSKENWPAAAKDFQICTKLNPQFWQGFYYLGISLYVVGNQNWKSSLQNAFRLNPSMQANFKKTAPQIEQFKLRFMGKHFEKNPPKSPQEFGARGIYYLGQKKYALAIKDLKEALKSNPNVAAYQHQLGIALEKNNYPAEAKAAYIKAAQLDGKNFTYQNAAAWFLLTCEDKNLQDAKKALSFSQRAYKLAQYNPAILDTHALALFRNGKARDAIRVQKTAISLLPKTMPPDQRKEFESRLKEFQAASSKSRRNRKKR